LRHVTARSLATSRLKETKMADEDFELPPDEPNTAIEVEGDEPEVDETDDELVTDPVGEPDTEAAPPLDQVARQPSRASEAVRRAKAEAKAAREERDRLQREMMDLLRERQAPQPPHVDPEMERQRLEVMSDGDRYEYLRQKDKAEMSAQLQRISLQLEVQNDASVFKAVVAGRPEFKRFEGQVEERFQALMAAGKPQSREAILKYLIGETIYQKGGKALAKAREIGAENIRRQQTRPTNSRSNVSGNDSADTYSAAEARLKRFHDQGGFL